MIFGSKSLQGVTENACRHPTGNSFCQSPYFTEEEPKCQFLAKNNIPIAYIVGRCPLCRAP